MNARYKLFFWSSMVAILLLFGSFAFLFMSGFSFSLPNSTGDFISFDIKVFELAFGHSPYPKISANPVLIIALSLQVFLLGITVFSFFKKHALLLIVNIILTLVVFILYFFSPQLSFDGINDAVNFTLGFGLPLMAITVFVAFLLSAVSYFAHPIRE